jgi:aspartate aminotransferase
MFAAAARPTVQTLSASRIREVANAGIGRADVLPFWFGESDQPTPAFIREAAAQALTAGKTFYTSNFGRPELRDAIAGYVSRLHGIDMQAERVAVTSSGVSALMVAAQLIVEPGDRVVAVTPLWPNIVEIPRILGGHITRVSLEVANGRWWLDVDRLLAALRPDTRVLLLNSPNNPTGWTIEAEQQAAILEHCRKHGIWIIADDVYERLVFRPGLRVAPSFLTRADREDRVISVNSFSKAWRMTGWRAGWLITPPGLMADLGKIIEYNTSCAPDFIQDAALAALTHGEESVAALHADLIAARAFLVDALRALPGVEVPEADGAMYAFLRLAGRGDSLDLAKQLVAQVGLGLAPGSAFGPEGEGWLRWCYAAVPEKLAEGARRFAAFLNA